MINSDGSVNHTSAFRDLIASGEVTCEVIDCIVKYTFVKNIPPRKPSPPIGPNTKKCNTRNCRNFVCEELEIDFATKCRHCCSFSGHNHCNTMNCIRPVSGKIEDICQYHIDQHTGRNRQAGEWPE